MTIFEWCILIAGIALAWPMLSRPFRTLYSVLFTLVTCWTKVKVTVREVDGTKRTKTVYVDNYLAFMKELKKDSVKTADGKDR